MASAGSRTFEDVKVGVRCKLAALWVAMLFLFAYGDIFGFFRPGQIQEVMAGEVSGMAITQGFLVAVSLYVAVASVMVFFSLVLSPRVNRWANIVLAGLYLVSIVASAARSYWESGRAQAQAAGQPPPAVSVPVGFTTFPDEIFAAPRSWVEQGYPTLTYFNQAERGGHFAAWEEPQLFSEEVRAAFRPLR